ncbi:MAG: BPL-N domain-containing protein [Nitrospirota bacterium]
MKESSKFKIQSSKLTPVAVLWDESFLWGVMAYKALKAGRLSFDLIRSEDIRKGRLKEYALLFVPGGWASNKLKALGDDGAREIKRFVHDGGAYLGFCGGAGLATMDGIGLVPVQRRPTKERVPSFSGRIELTTSPHPVWQGISESVFHAWWPSQFLVDGSVSVLAAYGQAMPDSFSSDVNVGDVEAVGSWPELERVYQINLDPKRLLGEPAVIEGRFGAGKVLLSLVHFDTPDDRSGAAMLQNLWKYLVPNAECGMPPIETFEGRLHADRGMHDEQTTNSELVVELEEAINDLIALGRRNFLWFRRNPMLLQWRRGVRGLEYCTLYVMVKEVSELLKRQDREPGAPNPAGNLIRIRELLLPFVEKAKHLLVRERYAMQNEHITYERCDDREIQALREELFSRMKSHGGLFKEVIAEVDRLLFSAMVRR